MIDEKKWTQQGIAKAHELNILALSDGTMAVLTGNDSYTEIEQIRNLWFEWVAKGNDNTSENWQDCWNNFTKTK